MGSRLDFFKAVWNSGWGNKITLIAGGLIFLIAIVGVIYGVLFQ